MVLTDDLLAVLDAIERGTSAYGRISARALQIEGAGKESFAGLVAYINWVDGRVHELQRQGLVEEIYLSHGDREVARDYDGYYAIMQRISQGAGREVALLLSDWRGRPRAQRSRARRRCQRTHTNCRFSKLWSGAPFWP